MQGDPKARSARRRRGIFKKKGASFWTTDRRSSQYGEIESADGPREGISVFARDITEQKRLAVQSLYAELAADFSPGGYWWELMVPADQIVVTDSTPTKSL